MSHFNDYMDGVPVKISEKYKRPPRIELPYSVSECPLRAQSVVDSLKYCSTFETNVLSKLKELRRAKETKKTERRHRLQLLEEAKQKKLDVIAAAEAEEKLKQLSVSEVSYPSTDEISALSPDEKADTNPAESNTKASPETVDVAAQEIQIPTTSNAPDPELNILQPIQVQSNYQQNSLLDDPDPLQEIKNSAKVTRIQHYNHNIETLTYKDFENDTSSPFDNVELKTINDMELLAQVLQSQRDSGTSCHPQMFEPGYTTIPNCGSQAQLEGVTYLPNAYIEQPIHGPGLMYSPEHYPVSNGYYVPENTCDNINMYMPNYQYYVPANSYQGVDPNYYNQIQPTDISQVPTDSTFIPQPYYFHCPPSSIAYPSPNVTYNNTPNQNQNQSPSSVSSHTVKSRSRSVPDIVKELDEELASAKLRANERSYNVSPAPKVVPETSGSKKREERRSRKKEHLPNPYDKLPSKLQNICQKIQGMGFPLDRVARVCSLLGDNDKKIIEGLLMVGELMDLGFSEGRVTAALAKQEFNKDKALDDLVS
ncbi:uncharacterized protein LOC106136134 [Amyelois transitella]|uniref:uncharacterized protein LOC106136134 n=1 Tax=Amyelois transitella TaxID=680683 RepID=UPI00067B5A05|nr:uncharacterized protein LOC106136134 [Amyelois transitella]